VKVGGEVEVTATVLDETGDPVAGVECSFSIHAQPGSDASVDPGPETTDAVGRATTTVSVGSTAGIVEVRADCDGISQVLSVEVILTALPPTGASGDGSDRGSVVVSLIAILAAASAAAAARYAVLFLGARRP
jgi:hypothetical protein